MGSEEELYLTELERKLTVLRNQKNLLDLNSKHSRHSDGIISMSSFRLQKKQNLIQDQIDAIKNRMIPDIIA